MIRTLRAPLLAALLLIAVGCSVTPTIGDDALAAAASTGDSVEFGFEPAGEAVLEAQIEAVPVSMPSFYNDGAIFDSYITEEYGDLTIDQLGAIQVVVGSYCLGLVDSESISYLTEDVALQDRVLGTSTDTCDDVHRSPVLISAERSSAETWPEAVNERFGRVFWWYGPDQFEAAAARYCETRPSFVTPAGEDIDLSVSAQIELQGMLDHGDCDLPGAEESFVLTSEAISSDSSLSETIPSDGALSEAVPSTVGNGTNGPGMTLYYLDGGVFNRQIHAMHMTSGATRKLTSFEGSSIRYGSEQVVHSPDGELVAYAAKDDPGFQVIGVGASVGGSEIVATRSHHGRIAWSGDSSSVLFRRDDKIMSVDVASLEETELVTAAEEASLALIGATSNWVAYAECIEECVVKLVDPTGSVELSSFEVATTWESNITLGPDSTQLFVIDAFAYRLQVVDIDGVTMSEAVTAFAGGSTLAPLVSADGRWVSYDGSFGVTALEVESLADEEPNRVDLFGDAEGYLNFSIWLPDSQGLVVTEDQYDGSGSDIKLLSLDGTITDLGVDGYVFAVVPGDPEGLADQ